MKTKNLKFLLLSIVLLWLGCTQREVFSEYKPIATQGWSVDSLYSFDVNIEDENQTYNVYLNIRNRGEYPYQNMWIYLKRFAPDSSIVNDTIECYLTDNRGKWLGSGVGAVYEMPVLYQQRIHFPVKGKYRYTLVHGMRDLVLKGVSDIGMKVEIEKEN